MTKEQIAEELNWRGKFDFQFSFVVGFDNELCLQVETRIDGSPWKGIMTIPDANAFLMAYSARR